MPSPVRCAVFGESECNDGASPWRVFWKITYPLLKPIFLVLLTNAYGQAGQAGEGWRFVDEEL